MIGWFWYSAGGCERETSSPRASRRRSASSPAARIAASAATSGWPNRSGTTTPARTRLTVTGEVTGTVTSTTCGTYPAALMLTCHAPSETPVTRYVVRVPNSGRATDRAGLSPTGSATISTPSTTAPSACTETAKLPLPNASTASYSTLNASTMAFQP